MTDLDLPSLKETWLPVGTIVCRVSGRNCIV